MIVYSVTRRGHRGESGAFVVCSSAALVAAILIEERERRFIPFFGIGGLHVDVIVDRKGRIASAGLNSSKHDRVAGRFDYFGLSADGFKILASKLSPSTNVVISLGVHAYGWDFDYFGELGFKIVPGILNIGIKSGIETFVFWQAGSLLLEFGG